MYKHTTYKAELYRNDKGNYRWAVLDTNTNVFYFANRYGQNAAKRLANKMNKNIKEK